MPPLLLLLVIGSAQAGPCEDLAAQVDPLRLEDDVRALAGATPIEGEVLRSRHVQHPDHARAEAWLSDRLDSLGLDWTRESFDAPALPRGHNLIADLGGGGPPVYVTAHYDSTGSGDPAWLPESGDAPGADDDASGVAATLEAARVLSGWTPGFEESLRFALFDTEEQGLLGSYHHVDQLGESDVLAVFNLDPLGFNAGGASNLWATFDPRFEDLAVGIQDSGEILDTPLQITTVNADLIGGDARSDHYPFWASGRPAVHVSSFPQPPEYHTPFDLPELVDLDFLADATRVVVHAACTAAVPRPEPLEPDDGAGCTGCSHGARGAAIPTVWALVLVAGWFRRRE